MENKPDIILGLDVSTTTIGICLLLNDGSDYGKIIELTHISPKVSNKINKEETLFLKAEIFRNEFIKKYKDLGISKVVIEEPLLRSTNVNTIGTLLRFNSMIALIIFEELKIIPNFISSYDARAFSFPELLSIRKFDKKGNEYPRQKIISAIKKNQLVLFGSYPWDIDKKVVMQEKVASIFPEIKWLYNKKGEFKKENYDASDSYICLLGQLNKEKYKELNFEISNFTINQNQILYTTQYWNNQCERIIYLTEKKEDNS